ncbi:hypothetical protein [Bifidobacterium oedipodis]|uniref:Lipoprotein n=1 Tax=Bifidobacterium oedipodis TaxID=2675322 RepID=A0A7Y0EQQ4_9BIFI|nr:hypothetical protein [Bifidobacterium sp. DSM 109957]NMM94709.1 hypothetical protein [Bifidobacterium sp. DSM 109957]
MKHLKKVVLAILAVTLAVGAGGCGNAQEAEVSDSVVKATSDLVTIDPEIMQAYGILRQQCARSRGFDVPVDYSTIPMLQGYADVGGIFRSEQEAVSLGYSMQTMDQVEGDFSEEDFEKTLGAEDRKRYEHEVIGDISDEKSFFGSCAAQAYAALFGSYEKSNEVLNTFNEMANEQTRTSLDDGEVRKAITDVYAPCMTKAGYPLRGLKAGELAGERFGRYRAWNEPPNAEEQAMARQDYACQSEAGIMERIDMAMERNAGAWMAANEATLLARYETLEEALGKANQVINGQADFDSLMAP